MSSAAASVVAMPTSASLSASVRAGDLRWAVEIAGRTATRGKTGTLPVLQAVKITTKDNGTVVISATDLKAAVGVTIAEANVYGVGAICVAPKALVDCLDGVPDATQIRLAQVKAALTLSFGASERTLQAFNRDRYPKLPTFNGPLRVLEPGLFAEWLGKVSPAMSDDDTRFHLCGVNVIATKQELAFAASDGHRLSRYIASVGYDLGFEGQATIASASVKELVRLMKHAKKFRIGMNDTHLCAMVTGARLITVYMSKLVEGQFPPVDQVTPKLGSMNAGVMVNRLETIKLLKRATKLAGKTHGVKLTVEANRVVWSVDHDEHSFSEVMESARCMGLPASVGFNPKYLIEALSAMVEERVLIHLQVGKDGTTLDPLLLRDRGVDKGFIGVIMPMRV